MGRFHGRNGRVYMGIASDTAVAEPVPYLADWTLNQTTDKIEVTAMGDTTKIYVAGLPDAAADRVVGEDRSEPVLQRVEQVRVQVEPAGEAVARRGVGLGGGVVHEAVERAGGVGGAVTLSSNWNAASSIFKVG